MASSHLKRLVAPKTWPILRKTTKFIIRPKPNGQTMDLTLPIVVVLREVLGLVETSKQARDVLQSQKILLNGKRIQTKDAAVGFMDVVSIADKNYRMLINENNKLIVVPAGKEEFTLQKISDKSTLKSSVTQLNFSSGKNLKVEKDTYKTNDTVAVDFNKKITQHYPLSTGVMVLLTGGNHIGKVGKVEKIDGKTITISVSGMHLETATSHAFVIGKDKPGINLA